MKYILRTDTIYDENKKAYTVYGIMAVSSNGEVIKSVPDVFFDKDKAEDFVDRCNKDRLPLVHLDDVIEDALVGL